MITCKKEILDMISNMPENLDIDDLMYKLYVFEKVKKSQEEIKKGNAISLDELKKEVDKW